MVRCSVTKPTTYQPIASLEAEQLVLGAILVRPEVMDQVDSTIQPDDFYRKAHGNIFQAILDLYTKSEPIDLVTVCALLRERNQLEGCGGNVFLFGLSEQVGFAPGNGSNPETHPKIAPRQR